MSRIVKVLLLSGALVGCSPGALPGAGETNSTPAPAPSAPAAASQVLRAEGFSVSCNAEALSNCTSETCAHETGQIPSVPLAWSFDGATGLGELCIATGCAAAEVIAPPGEAAGPGEDLVGLLLTAPVLFDEASGEAAAAAPTVFDGVVTMARSGDRFSIVQTNAGGAMIWTGACVAAGAD